ncbi:CPBP family intramembrane glutamate endopeptidase, partial [Streptomyces sp. NPDC054841]
MQAEAGRESGWLPEGGLSRRTLRSETLLVLALSLG